MRFKYSPLISCNAEKAFQNGHLCAGVWQGLLAHRIEMQEGKERGRLARVEGGHERMRSHMHDR